MHPPSSAGNWQQRGLLPAAALVQRAREEAEVLGRLHPRLSGEMDSTKPKQPAPPPPPKKRTKKKEDEEEEEEEEEEEKEQEVKHEKPTGCGSFGGGCL